MQRRNSTRFCCRLASMNSALSTWELALVCEAAGVVYSHTHTHINLLFPCIVLFQRWSLAASSLYSCSSASSCRCCHHDAAVAPCVGAAFPLQASLLCMPLLILSFLYSFMHCIAPDDPSLTQMRDESTSQPVIHIYAIVLCVAVLLGDGM